MAGDINWGVIGSGWVSAEFADGLGHVPGARLAGVCSRVPANAEAFARRRGGIRAYSDVASLLADPDIHIVYVGTPNSLHSDHCCAVLDAGKAVVCEKPFTVNSSEARRVIHTARARGLFCMEAMRMRFVPAMDRVRALLKDGAIGELRMISANFGFPAPYDVTNRFFNPSLGGGAFLDLGVYALSLAFHIFGPPENIVSAMASGAARVDEQSAAILSYSDGKLAVLAASLTAYVPDYATISGTLGEIRITPLFRPEYVSLSIYSNPHSNPKDAALTKRAGLRERAKSIPGLRSAVASGRKLMNSLRPADEVRNDLGREHVPFLGNGFNYEAAEAMRCLRAGERESHIMPLDESLKIMECLDAIRGQWLAASPS